MTAKETLKKYGLKTDVKSIKERMDANKYWKLAINECWRTKEITVDDIAIELAAADLTLLCELAEKGERVNAWGKESLNAIERAWIVMNDHGAETTEEITLVRHAIRIAREITKSYESEGEPK